MVGFENTSFTLEERAESYLLPVKVVSNGQTIRTEVEVSVAIVRGSGNATGKESRQIAFYIITSCMDFAEGDDYQLVKPNIRLNPNFHSANIEIKIVDDAYVLEGVKSVTLELRSSRGHVALFRPQRTTINIVDNDGK